jgi:hypothetical protein
MKNWANKLRKIEARLLQVENTMGPTLDIPKDGKCLVVGFVLELIEYDQQPARPVKLFKNPAPLIDWILITSICGVQSSQDRRL